MAEAEVVNTQVATPDPNVATPEPAAPEQPAVETGRTYTQSELDEIVGKVKENQRRRREELRRDLDVFKRMALEKRDTPAERPQPQTQDTSQRPKVENFANYDDYLESLADWKAESKIREREDRQKKESEAQRAERELQDARKGYAEREAKAREKYDDFEEVALSPTVPITAPMARAIIESEHGPEVAYYLGQNLDEARRISLMSPVAAIAALGRIEAKLEQPPAQAPKPSAAPAPIAPVAGKATNTTEEPSDQDDIRTWIRKRNRQVHGPRR